MNVKSLNKAKLPKIIAALGAMFVLGACGLAQWPPSGSGPGLAYGSGNDAFINASAVTAGKGDTVYAIARRHQVSPREIIEINNLRPPYELEIGQRIKLPGGRVHVVKKGEYLSLIAKNYNSNAFSIARINGVSKPYTIYPGQKLRIPRGSVDVATRAPSNTTTPNVPSSGSTRTTSNNVPIKIPTP
ncbi:MAG: LysM peptidoglycan-binding domain-containing protein, partial [Rhodospirillaceae bacterium]|nr:LysM peptidoglycan-binding domain-containing protein [Rhodospirillaceae bacterium]